MKFLILCLFLFPFTAHATTKYSPESVEMTIHNVFSDLGIGEEMVEIARCESTLNNLVYRPRDTNGYASLGLFQINKINGELYDWHIPYNNAKKAKEIYLKQGFKAWYNCSKKLKLIT